jgi:hypothetical protein
MKEYRITSENIVGKTGNDCYIAPDDPIWKMMGIDAPKDFGKYLKNVPVEHKDTGKNEKT